MIHDEIRTVYCLSTRFQFQSRGRRSQGMIADTVNIDRILKHFVIPIPLTVSAIQRQSFTRQEFLLRGNRINLN